MIRGSIFTINGDSRSELAAKPCCTATIQPRYRTIQQFRPTEVDRLRCTGLPKGVLTKRRAAHGETRDHIPMVVEGSLVELGDQSFGISAAWAGQAKQQIRSK